MKARMKNHKLFPELSPARDLLHLTPDTLLLLVHAFEEPTTITLTLKDGTKPRTTNSLPSVAAAAAADDVFSSSNTSNHCRGSASRLSSCTAKGSPREGVVWIRRTRRWPPGELSWRSCSPFRYFKRRRKWQHVRHIASERRETRMDPSAVEQ